MPEKFLTVQWMKLPGGAPTPAFEALCRRLAAGQTAAEPPSKKTAGPAPKPTRARVPPVSTPVQYPEFPRQEAGQHARFYGQAAAWTLHSAWISFNRLPQWVRIVAYCWLFVLLIKGCDTASDNEPRRASKADTEKIREISAKYLEGPDKTDVAGLAAQIARQFPHRFRSRFQRTDSGQR